MVPIFQPFQFPSDMPIKKFSWHCIKGEKVVIISKQKTKGDVEMMIKLLDIIIFWMTIRADKCEDERETFGWELDTASKGRYVYEISKDC